MMLGKLDIHIKMNETEHLSYTLQQKWTQNILYIIPETAKLLEENTGEKLHDICLGNDFMDDTKRIGNKTKNKQVGLYQTKKLLHRKETINRVKR